MNIIDDESISFVKIYINQSNSQKFCPFEDHVIIYPFMKVLIRSNSRQDKEQIQTNFMCILSLSKRIKKNIFKSVTKPIFIRQLTLIIQMKQKTTKPDLSIYLKPGLSLSQVEQAKSYFDELADKQTNFITASQIRQTLQSFGQIAPQNELHYTFQAVLDTFGPQSMNQKINFEQFLYLVTSNVTESDSRLDMKRLFNLYDDKRQGFLTKQKLRQIAEEYGIWITNSQLEAMILSANENGKVTEQDYYNLMTSQKSS